MMHRGEMVTLKLFMMGTGWGVPFQTAAPFPLKLEAWLRMTGVPYEAVIENNPGKGPKKKSPWVVDGDVCLGDSELIIAYLRGRHGVDLDAHLDNRQRALGLAWQRTFEEHYHQAYEHQLFLGRGGPERLHAFTRSLPPVLRSVVPVVLVSSLKKQLYARGLGRHREEEIVAMGKADLDAASAFLGDRAYFLGDEPSTVDATAFGFLGASVYVEGDNPLYAHAASLDNLMGYCERMRGRYFPETVSA